MIYKVYIKTNEDELPFRFIVEAENKAIAKKKAREKLSEKKVKYTVKEVKVV